ncbi:phosphatase PAP2 family protein [Lentibacter algarum]|uniref:phosphatase PAP2 family protein n=1 Tax=Lentibacter algarum TaxID=576131 RepID=UPI001C076304|nr:phosphatase PAP2 family protein [Lentibacter algarum]MBU2981329.1 phosphatase PAP2 family protein [Lentibacter algarum]
MSDSTSTIAFAKKNQAVGQRLSQWYRDVSAKNLFGLITLVYFSAGALFLFAVGGSVSTLFQMSVRSLSSFMDHVQWYMPVWLIVLTVVVALVLTRIRRHLQQVKFELLLSIMCATVFVATFGLVKNHLSMISPFWADSAFVALDRSLGLSGPYSFLSGFSTNGMLSVYFNYWLPFALYFPALLCLVDKNEERRKAFILLWAACWLILGHAFALSFMSVGPIFLEKLGHADAPLYAEHFAHLYKSNGESLMFMRDHLWKAYDDENRIISSGISAFPSVHVGMATVCGLYLADRLKEFSQKSATLQWPLLIAAFALPIGIVALYQMLSVQLGWHYAVDGVFSVVFMLGLFWFLRNKLGLFAVV